MVPKFCCSTGIIALSISLAATAGEWSAAGEAVQVEFMVRVDGEPVRGRFTSATARLRDDERGTPLEIQASIGTASATTGVPDIDEMLPAPPWFDVARHPEARYVTTRCAPIDEGRFRCEGRLSLKGRSAPVAVAFNWQPEGTVGRLRGSAELDRRRFRIGDGPFRDEPALANSVALEFDLRLTPVRARR